MHTPPGWTRGVDLPLGGQHLLHVALRVLRVMRDLRADVEALLDPVDELLVLLSCETLGDLQVDGVGGGEGLHLVGGWLGKNLLRFYVEFLF